MPKIHAVVPSFNRACQLHLLLESLERNAPNVFDVHVIYNYEGKEHAKAYHRLIERVEALHPVFPTVSFYHQTPGVEGFFGDFWGCTFSGRGGLVAFFVDDNVMFRKMTDVDGIRAKLTVEQSGYSSFSMRLGRNITHDGPQTDTHLIQPTIIDCDQNPGLVEFSYFHGMGTCHFAYPFSVDGHIYRKALLEPFVNMVNWDDHNNVNDMEGAIVGQIFRDMHTWPSWCFCYEESIVLNNVLNKINDKSSTRVGKNSVNPDNLALMYNGGVVIDYDKMDFSNVHQCHTDIPVGFRKYADS